MGSVPPDHDPSDRQLLQSFATAEAERKQAARERTQVGRWLRRLADIGIALAEGISGIAMVQRAMAAAGEPAFSWSRRVAKGDDDLKLGWALVARALGWIDALRGRLAAEAAAAKAVRERRESDYDPPEKLIFRMPRPREAPANATPLPPVCVRGKPTAEVLGQICADLNAAATLLNNDEAAGQIAVIAAAARALLGAPAETFVLLPAPELPQDAAEPAATPAAAMRLPGPDSG